MPDYKNKLFDAAMLAYENAYAPYSNFKVGAAVLSEKSQIFTGCNVENMSYPCGACAEMGAISNMISSGDKKIVSILVLANSVSLISPCGACLQRIKEFADDDSLIYLANLSGIQKAYKLSEMLPIAFDEKELKND